MPAADLTKYYFVPKVTSADRSRIAHVPLPVSLGSPAIEAFVAAYEVLAKGTDDAEPKIVGMTESLLDIEANANRVEVAPTDKNPFGINGSLIYKEVGPPTNKYVQPVQFKGINPDATMPTGFDAGDAMSYAKQFLLKYGKIQKRVAGVLTGLDPDFFRSAGDFDMH